MAHSTEITSTDDQISLLPRTEKDEIEEGKKVDHLIDTNGQDPSGSQTKKSLNQIFAKKLKDLDNSSIKSRTIFKVNVSLRESNPDAYAPKMVSIGPYHKKNPQLHQMEKYKLLYLRRFLGRKEGLDVESCISELEKLKEKAINCYEDVEDDSQFCEMLLLDGCFVVEFIRECCEICPEGEDKISNTNGFYIFRDLMLLENQLPFFILNKLHDTTKQNDVALALLAGSFLSCFVILPQKINGSIRENTPEGNIKHLLHLLHILSCRGSPMKKPNDDNQCYMDMPNATQLSEAGVRFEMHHGTSIFDIEFQNGLMLIPQVRVADDTETLLRNLIAYEQQSVDVQPKHFVNFSIFMNYLIDSDKDVNLLRQKGIIENWLGDNKEVANLYNKIGNGVLFTDGDFYYKEECRKAIKHCKKPWNKYRANLKHNYFSSPWVGASTVAAIVLLILTFIQTILAFIDLVNK